MRAAVLRAVNGPVTIEDVDIDQPGPQEVLIRTAAAGLCHSDVSAIQGRITMPLPAVIGHESAGVVEQVGSLVVYVKPGDHVIMCYSNFCGRCEYCLSGRPALCAMGGSNRRAEELPRLSQDGKPLFQMSKPFVLCRAAARTREYGRQLTAARTPQAGSAYPTDRCG